MLILAISGSLRAASTNTSVLLAFAMQAPPSVEVVLYRDLGALPPFNPDLDTHAPPPEVQALRAAVGRADALLICSPEYAHGIAGSLKNALDWLVGSVEFPNKPVAVVNASQRSVHADAHLREVLSTMSARIIESASIVLPLGGRALDAAGIAGEPVLSSAIRAALDHIASVTASDSVSMET